jgi:glycosyltransferase involved in cell wall biosynthesis
MVKLLKKINYWKFIYSNSGLRIKSNSKEDVDLILITIAFNEASFIEKQIDLLKKYVRDRFEHIIVDNSSSSKVREEIYEICLKKGVGYQGVPLTNPYQKNKSHAAAMHWAYFQIVIKSAASVVGFLDHDIFPIKPYSISNRMTNGIYGRVMHSYTKSSYRKEVTAEIPYWSLWAGFCFFDKSLIKGSFPWSFNFFSKHFPDGYFLDTGGGLWNQVYSKIPYPGPLASYEIKKISDQDEGIQNSFELLDDTWLHFVSLSNWRRISSFEKKKELFEEMIQSALT